MRALLLAIICLVARPVWADVTLSTQSGPVRVQEMISGLNVPWGLGFLEDGSILVTERDGQMLWFDQGKRHVVRNLPRVYAEGQGGLLDVEISKRYRDQIYLTYAAPKQGGGATTLLRAVFKRNPARLENVQILYQQPRGRPSGRHFGSRAVEARDGSVFLTIGDRGTAKRAQDLGWAAGKVIRVTQEGSPHPENPFLRQAGALPEIYSLGHRNPQGAALDARGRLWTVEHGAKGGDEINRPVAGRNYGWPVISYGTHYSGEKIGQGTRAPGMEQPAFYWDPSIAPSGMMIYSGKMFSQWKDDIFIGSLKFDYLSRVTKRGNKLAEAERLFRGEFARIRDVVEAPDGAIWFLAAGEDAAFRLSRN